MAFSSFFVFMWYVSGSNQESSGDNGKDGEKFKSLKNNLEFKKNKEEFKKVLANPIFTTLEFKSEEKIFAPGMLLFSDPLYGVEGKYFFPGNYFQANALLQGLSEHKDLKQLLQNFDSSTFLKSTLKAWSYKDLIYSVLYYCFNYELVNMSVSFVHWKLIFDLIESPLVGTQVFLFVKKNNITSFSSKKSLFLGVKYFLLSRIDPPFNKSISSLLNIKFYYRLLILLNIEKPLIRNLIKKIVVDKNLKLVENILEKELQNLKIVEDIFKK